MKLPLTQRRHHEENLIPLINIVFLMLIFFMLAGRILPPDLFEVNPPLSSSETPLEPEELTILVASDGRVALAEEQITKAQLGSLVAQHLSEQQAGISVKLKADAGLQAQTLLEIIEILRLAGVEKVTLLTTLRR